MNESKLEQALSIWLGTDSWQNSKEYLIANLGLFFSPEMESFIDQVIERAEKEGNRYLLEAFEDNQDHKRLLRRCKEVGVDLAYQEIEIGYIIEGPFGRIEVDPERGRIMTLPEFLAANAPRKKQPRTWRKKMREWFKK